MGGSSSVDRQPHLANQGPSGTPLAARSSNSLSGTIRVTVLGLGEMVDNEYKIYIQTRGTNANAIQIFAGGGVLPG